MAEVTVEGIRLRATTWAPRRRVSAGRSGGRACAPESLAPAARARALSSNGSARPSVSSDDAIRQRKQRRRKAPSAEVRGTSSCSASACSRLLAAIAVLSVAGYVIAIAATAPDLSELKPIDKGESSVIFAADGSRLGYVQSDEIRTPVAWSDMPEYLREATVAIEDERFYEHEGVDYNAIVRAGVKNLESGKTVQGGSTITQQLVRALYIKDPERNFARKIREAKLASELEDKHSQAVDPPELPERRPLRDRRTGAPRSASRPPPRPSSTSTRRTSTSHEAAMLAGLPQAPSQYNPFRNPTAALRRRNEVLEQMARERLHHRRGGRRGRSQAPLRLKHGTRYTARREPYFFDYVAGEADRGVRRRRLPPRRAQDLHARSTRSSRTRRARRSRASCRPRRAHRRRSSRSTPQRLHPRDGLERHLQGPHASTSPPRATASPARPSRRWC